MDYLDSRHAAGISGEIETSTFGCQVIGIKVEPAVAVGQNDEGGENNDDDGFQSFGNPETPTHNADNVENRINTKPTIRSAKSTVQQRPKAKAKKSKKSSKSKSKSNSTTSKAKPKPKRAIMTDGLSLTCPTCSKSFKNRRLLGHHIKIVHIEDPKCCDTCGKTFKNIELLKVHNRRNHLNPKFPKPPKRPLGTSPLYCIICNIEFNYKEALKQHEENEHNSPDTLTCPNCNKTFSHVDALKNHIRRAHATIIMGNGSSRTSTSQTVTCDICQTFLKSSHALKAHLKNVHFDPQKNAIPEANHNSNTLLTLLPDVTQQQQQQKCAVCLSNFRNKDQLNLHMSQVHGRGEFILCGDCGKGFSDRMKLLEHSKTHSNSKDEVWPCRWCDKLFRAQKYQLKHERKAHDNSTQHRNGNMFQNIDNASNFLSSQTSLQEEISASTSGRAKGRNPTKTKASQPSELPDFSSTQPDNDFDDWFSFDDPIEHSHSPPSTPIPRDMKPNLTFLGVKVKAEGINQANHSTNYSDEELRLPNHTPMLDFEDLILCPKLKMKSTVPVKKYIPLPYREGHIFCDICVLNFRHGRMLVLHKERAHGIKHVPKKPKRKIINALRELRSQTSKPKVVESSKKRGRGPSKKTKNQEKTEPSENADLGRSQSEEDTSTGPEEPDPEGAQSTSDSTTWPCVLCEKVADSKRKLEDHKKYVHGDTPQTCHICKTVLANSQYLGRHMRWVHTHDPVPCDICGKEFGSSLKLGMHKRRVHRAQIYTCTICRCDFKTKGPYRQHMRNTHEDDGTRHFCDKCPRVFKRVDSFRRHCAEAHLPDDVCFPCEKCGRPYKNVFALRKHMKDHAEGENFRCMFCSAKFNTKRKKRAHEDKYHWLEEGYPCKVCNQMYENGHALEKHILYQHSEQDLETLYYEPAKLIRAPQIKPYTSYKRLMFDAVDPKLSTRPSKAERGNRPKWRDLTQEERNKRLNGYYYKPKSCSSCGFVCTNRHEMYKHIAKDHPERASIRCDECNLGFVVKKDLYLHNFEVHGAPKPLMCTRCGVGFISQDRYRAHMELRHEGNRTCNICNKKQETCSALRLHMKIHHGVVVEKPAK